MHCAAYQGSASCLSLLIRKFGGRAVATPRDTPGGRLPLHVAASAGSAECARLILTAVGSEEAGLESPDYAGRTPLLSAALAGQCNAIGGSGNSLSSVVRSCLEKNPIQITNSVKLQNCCSSGGQMCELLMLIGIQRFI